MLESEYRLCRISIHAPPRGATHGAVECPRRDVFQFTPLREGRRSTVSCPSACTKNFNSRPSARGDTLRARITGIVCIFQFTPLREGRHACDPCYITITRFQFTPLREGRHIGLNDKDEKRQFQFTPLREGRHDDGTRVLKSYLFQFTPLREGRRCPWS